MGEEKPRVDDADAVDIGADDDLDLTEEQGDEVVGGQGSAGGEEEEEIQA